VDDETAGEDEDKRAATRPLPAGRARALEPGLCLAIRCDATRVTHIPQGLLDFVLKHTGATAVAVAAVRALQSHAGLRMRS